MNSTENEQSYIESEEERESGHVDTREANQSCDSLGCDLSILEVSVAG